METVFYEEQYWKRITEKIKSKWVLMFIKEEFFIEHVCQINNSIWFYMSYLNNQKIRIVGLYENALATLMGHTFS